MAGFYFYRDDVVTRFYYVCASFIMANAVFFVQKKYFICFILFPISKTDYSQYGYEIVYRSAEEVFISSLVISVLVSFFFILFFFSFHTFLFFMNGLYILEQLIFLLVFMFSFFFSICSLYMSFQFVLPQSLVFFEEFYKQSIQNEVFNFEFFPEITAYLYFCYKIFFFVCVGFQMPIFIIFLLCASSSNGQLIATKRKFIYFFFFFLSSCFAPPDFISQFLLFGIAFFFFEISFLIFCIFYKISNKEVYNSLIIFWLSWKLK